MLRVDDLHAGYSGDLVVHGVSLEVRPGAIACLIGTNGAGKTTTLKAIAGLVPMTQGAVHLAGGVIRRPVPDRMLRAGVALVPEGRGVLSGLSVEENLLVGAFTVPDAREAQRRLDEVYGRFPRLKERSAISAGMLSGGEQQMMAIGRALMSRPAYLLLDEPSMGLSPLLVGSVAGLIQDLARNGLGILLSEQNASMALAIADFGYVIDQGRIVLCGTGAQLASHDGVRRAYLGWEEQSA